MLTHIDADTHALTINYPDYGTTDRNYGDLFDDLGDEDIITASEIGRDVIVADGEVYLFTMNDEGTLKREGTVTLEHISSLKDFIDPGNGNHTAFLKWYFNTPKSIEV